MTSIVDTDDVTIGMDPHVRFERAALDGELPISTGAGSFTSCLLLTH